MRGCRAGFAEKRGFVFAGKLVHETSQAMQVCMYEAGAASKLAAAVLVLLFSASRTVPERICRPEEKALSDHFGENLFKDFTLLFVDWTRMNYQKSPVAF